MKGDKVFFFGNAEEAIPYIGKMGYFGDSADRLNTKGCLIKVQNYGEFRFQRLVNASGWRYFVPMVEPEFRPYTKKEAIPRIIRGVLNKESGDYYSIGVINDTGVLINGTFYDYAELFDEFTHLDGSTLGIED